MQQTKDQSPFKFQITKLKQVTSRNTNREMIITSPLAYRENELTSNKLMLLENESQKIHHGRSPYTQLIMKLDQK